MKNYDVIVVGAGHAGVEAALAAARYGLKTALFTIYLDNIAMMSCNPSVGGPGKSHLVSELGMLGGEMARHIDNYNLQLKNLNHTKGLASRITRAQADKYWYRIKMREIIEKQENLELVQGIVVDLIVEDKKVMGVEDNLGIRYGAKAVVLCTGTFLGGEYVMGDVSILQDGKESLQAWICQIGLQNMDLNWTGIKLQPLQELPNLQLTFLKCRN